MSARVNSEHEVRRCAMQALYQWSFTGESVQQIVKQFLLSDWVPAGKHRLFRRLVMGTVTEVTELDRELAALADRDLKQLDPLELSLMRLGLWELHHRKEVSKRVILAAMVKLAAGFGATDSYRYVNAVLDKLGEKLRPDEQTDNTVQQ